MSIVERIRKAWASFVSSFDYEPTRALAVTEPADTQVLEIHPPDVQAALDRIAKLPADDLPQIVSKQARHDDGTPVIGPDGQPVLLRQTGEPAAKRALASALAGMGRTILPLALAEGAILSPFTQLRRLLDGRGLFLFSRRPALGDDARPRSSVTVVAAVLPVVVAAVAVEPAWMRQVAALVRLVNISATRSTARAEPRSISMTWPVIGETYLPTLRPATSVCGLFTSTVNSTCGLV